MSEEGPPRLLRLALVTLLLVAALVGAYLGLAGLLEFGLPPM